MDEEVVVVIPPSEGENMPPVKEPLDQESTFKD